MRTNSSNKRLIPITALRHLYQFLRAFPKKDFHLQCAMEFDRKPKALIGCIASLWDFYPMEKNPRLL